MTATAHKLNGHCHGVRLAGELFLNVVGEEGHDLKIPCPFCNHPHCGRLHSEDARFGCYACHVGANSYEFAVKYLNGDKERAKSALIAAGIFDREPPKKMNGNGSGHVAGPAKCVQGNGSSAPTSAPLKGDALLLAVCQAKKMPVAGFKEFHGQVSDGGNGDTVLVPAFKAEARQQHERGEKLKASTWFRLWAPGDARDPDGKGKWTAGGGSGVFLNDMPMDGDTVDVMEGVKDGAAAVGTIGLKKVLGMPGNYLPPEYAPLLKGCHVRLHAHVDPDGQGEKGRLKTAANLRGVAASILFVSYPKDRLATNGGKDLRDLLSLADGEKLARKAIDNAKPWDGSADSKTPAEKLEPPLSVREIVAKYPSLREPVINSLLRRGETANIVAAPKVGKSWLAYGLGICQVTGKRWLGTFLPVPGSVLLLDNEVHSETLAYRIPHVAKAYGIDPGEYQDKFFTYSFRGQNVDIDGIARYLGQFDRGQFSLIIVDALYRTLPDGTDENSNSDMTKVFNCVDQFASKLDAAVCLIHHSSKGLQSGKGVTDVGAGAGAQSRACDAHVILRPHATDGAVVLEAVTRSFPPVDPICLRFAFPTWNLADELDPSELKTEKPRQSVEKVAAKVLSALADGPKTINAIKNRIGRNPAAIADALQFLQEKGEVAPTKIKMRNGEYDGFQIVNPNHPNPNPN